MRSQKLIYGILAVWAAAMVFIGANLMVSHWVPMPLPDDDGSKVLQASLTSLQSDSSDQKWTVCHFLYAKCPCSRRVFEHVVSRPPHENTVERLILIGDDSELAERARNQGFHVESVQTDELLAKYGIESAPLFSVSDPQGSVRYSGGYTDRKQAFQIRDREIVDKIVAGGDVEPLPVFGCAVSRQLQSVVDPLGLKYKNQ